MPDVRYISWEDEEQEAVNNFGEEKVEELSLGVYDFERLEEAAENNEYLSEYN
jgi:hypothetical protein